MGGQMTEPEGRVAEMDGELRRAIERLTTSVDQLRTELVRKDVYEADQRTRDAEVSGLRDDVRELKVTVERNETARQADRKADEERQIANRRLILTALASPLLMIIIQLYLQSHIGGAS